MQNNDTKDRIIRTAIDMFSTLGYTQSTMRELAARVGIKPASLYYHYPAKDALLDEILCAYMDRDRRNRVPVETLVEAARALSVPDVLRMMFVKYRDDEDLVISLKIIRIAVGYQFEYPKAREVFDYLFYQVGLGYRQEALQALVTAGIVEAFDSASAAYTMTSFSMMRILQSMNQALPIETYAQEYFRVVDQITAFIAPLIHKIGDAVG